MRSAPMRTRWFLWVLPVLLIATFSSSACALGLFGTGERGGSFLESVPGLGSLDVGGMKLTPSVRVGHQWIGLNFNLPTLSGFRPLGPVAPIDIQLRDAHVWVGSVELEGRLFPALSFFVNAEGNAKVTAGAVTSEEPLQVTSLGAHRWDASDLEWWSVEGGLSYRFRNDVSILAGLKREHLSFGLDNPRTVFGEPINLFISIPGVGFLMERVTADFQLKLWTPYLGLRFTGPNYQASLTWTPFVNAAVKVPDSFFTSFVIFSGFVQSLGVEWKYSMFQVGTQIEGDFRYDLKLSSNLSINVWAKGSWLKIRGRGNLDQIFNQFASIAVPPFLSFPGSAEETATLGRYQIAAGLGAELNF
jgi:hypothetical protein